MLLTSLISIASAGPWIRDPGHWYAKAGVSTFAGDEYVDPTLDEPSALAFNGVTASVYGEVGVFPGGQLLVDLPYSSGRNWDTELGYEYRTRGFGDARFGLGLDVPGVELPLSVSAIVRVPLYDQSALPLNHPQIGDENVDLDVVAALGGALPARGQMLWGSVEGGFRARTQWAPSGNPPADYSNGLPYAAQIGWVPVIAGAERGWVAVTASGLAAPWANAATRRFHQVGASVAGHITHGVHVELGAQQVFLAQGATTGRGFSVGLSHRR